MFAEPGEVLAKAEGTLAERPFPELLRALSAAGRTVVLELRRNQLEKKITIEDGWPVGCRSNLLHETLGRFLVDRGKLNEQQCHDALAQAARDGEPLGEVLVKRGLLTAYDLYRGLQQRMARSVIDCFTWTDAKYRFLGAPPGVDTPLKMNPAQLVLTGATTVLPFEVVAQGLTFFDGQQFARVPDPPEETRELKLSSRDQRVLQILSKRPTFEGLVADGKLTTEEAMRRLYAFSLLGMVRFAEDVPETPAQDAPATTGRGSTPSAGVPAVPPPPVPTPLPAFLKAASAPVGPEAPETTGRPDAEDEGPSVAEVETRRNAIMEAFLKHRTQDPFELLGLDTKATLPEIRRAYFAFAEKYRPAACTGALASIVDKAEELAIAGAKAVATLADYEGRNLAIERHLRKKKEAKEKKKGGDAASAFRIQTDLLDATEQYKQAQALIRSGTWDAAVGALEYACDVDSSRAQYRADLGWARYNWQPSVKDKALADFAHAIRLDPACHLAHYYEGRVREASGEMAKAEEAYRRAIKAKPDERKYTDALRDLLQAAKRK